MAPNSHTRWLPLGYDLAYSDLMISFEVDGFTALEIGPTEIVVAAGEDDH
jgi:hypothetical protein